MNDEIEFTEYLKIFGKHWIIASISFIIVLGAIITYTMYTPQIYEARSLVVITNQDQANFLLGGSTVSKVADIETQKIIIQGSGVMYPVYSTFDERTFTLSVNNIKNSNIIEIIVQSTSSENASAIANHIATNYIDHVTQIRKQDAEDSVQFITSKISSYDEEISSLDTRLLYYKDLGANITQDQRVEYQNIEREITAKNKIYDYLLTKREEAALTASVKNINVKVIEYADVPLKPIKPNVMLNIALGIILAIGASFGSVMTIHAMNNTKPKKK